MILISKLVEPEVWDTRKNANSSLSLSLSPPFCELPLLSSRCRLMNTYLNAISSESLHPLTLLYLHDSSTSFRIRCATCRLLPLAGIPTCSYDSIIYFLGKSFTWEVFLKNGYASVNLLEWKRFS